MKRSRDAKMLRQLKTKRLTLIRTKKAMEDEIRQLHPELFKAIDREAAAKLGAVRRVATDEGLSPDVADMIERNIRQASQLCDVLNRDTG